MVGRGAGDERDGAWVVATVALIAFSVLATGAWFGSSATARTSGQAAGAPGLVPLSAPVAGSGGASCNATHPCVTFTETGLPLGTLTKKGWNVALNTSIVHATAASVSFGMPTGTSAYLIRGPAGYAAGDINGDGVPDNALGLITPGTTNQTVTVTFAKGTTDNLKVTWLGCNRGACVGPGDYCPPPSYWYYGHCVPGASVTVAGIGPKTTFHADNLTPSTFGYNLTTNAGWVVCMAIKGEGAPSCVSTDQSGDCTAMLAALAGAGNASCVGNLTLSKATDITLTFVYPFKVTFTETGLPAGSSWSVKVTGKVPKGYSLAGCDGTAVTTNQTSCALGNGTYAVHIDAPKGYSCSVPDQRDSVNGAATTAPATCIKK